MTSTAKVRARTLARIVAYYSGRPSRWYEVVRWASARGRSTVDMRLPWWPFPAIAGVREALSTGARVFEFGGGGSTLWLHDLGASVTVVEHDADWFGVLQSKLRGVGELILREPEPTGLIASAVRPDRFFDSYVAVVSGFPPSTFDLVIVDGRARVECGLAAMDRVKPGGMLLLDDSDRPRYQQLLGALAGWDRTDYTGVKPSAGPPCRTTVWRRPV